MQCFFVPIFFAIEFMPCLMTIVTIMVKICKLTQYYNVDTFITYNNNKGESTRKSKYPHFFYIFKN